MQYLNYHQGEGVDVAGWGELISTLRCKVTARRKSRNTFKKACGSGQGLLGRLKPNRFHPATGNETTEE
jgi:hypothetical protein